VSNANLDNHKASTKELNEENLNYTPGKFTNMISSSVKKIEVIEPQLECVRVPVEAIIFAIERVKEYLLLDSKSEEDIVNDQKWSQFYNWFYLACQEEMF
jgi:hypothetical protein